MLSLRFPVLFVLLTSVLWASFAQAEAGGGDSGGGAVVVCRSSLGQIQSVQMLDLFEGQVRHRHTHPDPQRSHDQIIAALIQRLSFARFNQAQGEWSMPAAISREIKELSRRAEFLPLNVALNQPTDLGSAHAIVVPDGCRIEAVGFRESSGVLVISSALYHALDEVNKAAFWMHEAIYGIYTRTNILSDAEGTWPLRRLISALFANNTTLGDLASAISFFFHRIDSIQGPLLAAGTHVFADITKAESQLAFGYRVSALPLLREQTSARLGFFQASAVLNNGTHLTCQGGASAVHAAESPDLLGGLYSQLSLPVQDCANTAPDSIRVSVAREINLEGTSARDGMSIMQIEDKAQNLVVEVQTNPIIVKRRPVRSTLSQQFEMNVNIHFLRDRTTYESEKSLAKYPF